MFCRRCHGEIRKSLGVETEEIFSILVKNPAECQGKMIEGKSPNSENSRTLFKSRKIDLQNRSRVNDFDLTNSKPHSPHSVVRSSTSRVLISCQSVYQGLAWFHVRLRDQT